MKSFFAYDHRPGCFEGVAQAQWCDWIWQQQNSVRNRFGLKKFFPRFPSPWLKMAEEWEAWGFRFLITPYVAALIEKDLDGNPLEGDPIWRQVFPYFSYDGEATGGADVGEKDPSEYSKNSENWEVAEEMISPIAQHKYDNRVIIYTGDACLGYCVYCFRSLQSNSPKEKHGGRPHWKATMEAISTRPGVEEVILSGGDPLLFDNANLEEMLKDLRGIPHVKALRIHTRAWLHNPYRIDDGLCALLKKYEVTEVGVHTIHPVEITGDFLEAVARVRESGARTLLMCDTPLIKGVNDDAKILRELFMELYTAGVKPYYLSHNMPNIPGASFQRTSVRRGVQLLDALKRKISNPAMPEYIITHSSGKKTVPDCEEGTADFVYSRDERGWPVVRFVNWRGVWETYLDAKDL